MAALLDLMPVLRSVPDFLLPIKSEGKRLHKQEVSLFRGLYLKSKQGLSDGTAKVCTVKTEDEWIIE